MISVDFAVCGISISFTKPFLTILESATTKPVIIITVICMANVSRIQKPLCVVVQQFQRTVLRQAKGHEKDDDGQRADKNHGVRNPVQTPLRESVDDAPPRWGGRSSFQDRSGHVVVLSPENSLVLDEIALMAGTPAPARRASRPPRRPAGPRHPLGVRSAFFSNACASVPSRAERLRHFPRPKISLQCPWFRGRVRAGRGGGSPNSWTIAGESSKFLDRRPDAAGSRAPRSLTQANTANLATLLAPCATPAP